MINEISKILEKDGAQSFQDMLLKRLNTEQISDCISETVSTESVLMNFVISLEQDLRMRRESVPGLLSLIERLRTCQEEVLVMYSFKIDSILYTIYVEKESQVALGMLETDHSNPPKFF